MRGDLGAAPRTGDLRAAPRRGELRPEVRRWRFIGSDSLVCAQNHPSTTQKALSPRHAFCPADQHRVPYFLVDSDCPADRRAQCVCVCVFGSPLHVAAHLGLRRCASVHAQEACDSRQLVLPVKAVLLLPSFNEADRLLDHKFLRIRPCRLV